MKFPKEIAVAIASVVVFLPLAIYFLCVGEIPYMSSALAAIGFMFLPMLVRLIFKIRVSWLILILIIIHVFCTLVVGEMFDLYANNSWWDKISHTYGGLILTVIAFCVVDLVIRETDIRRKFTFALFGAITISLSLALCWEIAEFTIDSIVGSNMQRYTPRTTGAVGARFALMDTMYDVLCHVLGLGIFVFFAFFIRNTRVIREGLKKINRKTLDIK